MNTSPIGERIRTARVRIGLSQEELAYAASVARSEVSHFETGRREPTLRKLRAICKALGLDLGTIAALVGKK